MKKQVNGIMEAEIFVVKNYKYTANYYEIRGENDTEY